MPMLWSSPRSLGQGGNASLLSDEPGDTGMLRTPDGAVHYEDRSDYKREVSLPPSPVGAAVWISSRGDVAISRARCWDSIRGHQPAERDQGHAPGSAYRGSTARERQCPAARAHPQRVATRESRPRLYCCSHFPTSSCRCIFLCLSGEHRCRRPIFRASGKSAPAPSCGASVGRSARGGGRKWRSSSRYVGTVGRLMVVTAVSGVVFV